MRGSRTLATVMVVGLGVAGAAAAAAALESAGSGDGSTASTDSTASTTTTSTSSTTTTVAPTLAPTSAVSLAENVERSTEGCDGQIYKNHGQYVSSVAHDSSSTSEDITKAAQSSCGKPVAAPQDTEVSEVETTEAPDTTGSSAHGAGHAGNRDRGKGNE